MHFVRLYLNIFFSTYNWAISLKIGHVMQFSMRSSKMEFANHFAKIHTIVFLQISTIGSLISEKWKLSSFELIFVLNHHSSSKNELRIVCLSFLAMWVLFVLNCEKAMAWFLAKCFANSIFEFLVLHCIIHPIFRFISPLEVQKLEPCIHIITTTK